MGATTQSVSMVEDGNDKSEEKVRIDQLPLK